MVSAAKLNTEVENLIARLGETERTDPEHPPLP